MDFSLDYTEEQETFAKEVREWLDVNAPPSLVSPRDPLKATYELWLKQRELGLKLGEKGWLYPGHPRQYGGGGLDVDRCFVLRQEVAERHFSLPPWWDSGSLAVAAIMACGTEEQKMSFLPPILKGQAHTWQLFTEPEAGTDVANQHINALRSEREHDYFIVNGGKIFVGCVPSKPDQFLLLTRSDTQAPRYQNLAMFIAPANLPGITIQPLDLFTPGLFSSVCGLATDHAAGVKHSVFFDDVKLHESYLIGGEKDGWKVANAALILEHGEGAEGIVCNMVAEKLLERCRKNPDIKDHLKKNPQLLDRVIDVYISSQVERLFSIRNAWQNHSRKRVPYTGPQLAVYMKMLGARLGPIVAEVLGPGVLTNDDKHGLDGGLFEVGERSGVCFAPGGTPEALKIVMSRTLAIGR